MTEASGNGTAGTLPPAVPAHPYPFARLFFAVGFGVLAWLVFDAILILAVVQFALIAINGHAHDDIKAFSRSLNQYLFELFAYIVFARDEQPFPFGPFPKGA